MPKIAGRRAASSVGKMNRGKSSRKDPISKKTPVTRRR